MFQSPDYQGRDGRLITVDGQYVLGEGIGSRRLTAVTDD